MLEKRKNEEFEEEDTTEYYANAVIPESVEVLTPVQSINEAKKEEAPWRMDKDRKGTGYHEAWHVFTQMLLTKEQKRSLYKEVTLKEDKFKDHNQIGRAHV